MPPLYKEEKLRMELSLRLILIKVMKYKDSKHARVDLVVDWVVAHRLL